MNEVPEGKQNQPSQLHTLDCGISGDIYNDCIKKESKCIQNMYLQRRKFIWLGNLYFDCPWNVQEMISQRMYDSGTLEFHNFPASFNIKMKMLTTANIRVELHRRFKDQCFHDRYFLRIYFEIDNSLHPGKYTDMPFDSTAAKVNFPLYMLYTSSQSHGATIVKCGIWMYEKIPTKSRASEMAEINFQESLHEYISLNPSTFDDMIFINDCIKMSDLFSDRHGEGSLEEKLRLLKRTLVFSNVLAERKKHFESNEPLHSLTPIDLVLGYIYNGITHFIQKEECLQLFRISFLHGLVYLQDECEGFLASNLDDDCDFLVDVISLAHTLERSHLLCTGLDYFFKQKGKVLKCDLWQKLLSCYPYEGRFVLSLVNRVDLAREKEIATKLQKYVF